MKKILFVAASAILLAAGCQKTEVLNQAVGDPMTFSTEMSKLTKSATADGMDNLKSQNFKVWAYTAYEDALNSVIRGSVYKEINGIEVSFVEGQNAWGTATEYYWPGTARELDFFAVSTGTTPNVTIGDQAGQESLARTMTVTGYTVDHTDPNDDLMVADFVRQHQGMNDKAVSLKFRHALSKVQFKFVTTVTANSTDKVVINGLSVAGLNVIGDLNVTEGTEEADASTGVKKVSLAWDESSLTGAGDDVVFSQVKDLELTGEAQSYAAWLVLPQSIANLTLVVDYTIQGKENQTFDHTFALATESVDSWDINQVTTYTINISPNKISFSPSVEDWDEETPVTDGN